MPKRKKPDPRFSRQPAVEAILNLVRRPQGATTAEIAAARKVEEHTVRAAISRLGSRGGIKIKRARLNGHGTVYFTGRKAVRS